MGPFEIVNALRSLQPDATHTMIVKFTPYAGHIVSVFSKFFFLFQADTFLCMYVLVNDRGLEHVILR